MKEPHAILTAAVYDLEAARTALHLTKTTLRRELRLRRLRVAKRAGRYFILGEWLLEWIKTGEMCAVTKANELAVVQSETINRTDRE